MTSKVLHPGDRLVSSVCLLSLHPNIPHSHFTTHYCPACHAFFYLCAFLRVFLSTRLPSLVLFDWQTPIHPLKPISNITSSVKFFYPSIHGCSLFWTPEFFVYASIIASRFFHFDHFLFLSLHCGNFKDYTRILGLKSPWNVGSLY